MYCKALYILRKECAYDISCTQQGVMWRASVPVPDAPDVFKRDVVLTGATCKAGNATQQHSPPPQALPAASASLSLPSFR